MIGFILGTSEGKKILKLVNKYTEDIAVTTATDYGGQLLSSFKIKKLNTKPLNKEEMEEWIKKNKINILVDASHPYAVEVTKNSMDIARRLNINYIRYERPGALEEVCGKNIIKVKDYNEAVNEIKNIDGNVMNTTGGNNIDKFIDIDFKYRIIHRILPSASVLDKIIHMGVKVEDIIAIKGPIKYELECAFIKQFNIKAIITKDSGKAGGVMDKLKAAQDCNIKMLIIEKPKLNYDKVFYDEENLVQYIKDNI